MGTVESKTTEKVAAEKTSIDFKPPDNDFQLVFEAIKDMEYTLMAHFDSSGDTLHEMISTTNQKLPLDLVVDMRELATIRNNMAHEYSIDKLQDRQNFIDKYQKCVRRLSDEINRRKNEEEIFYNEVVQRHRQLHPRPALVLEEEKPIAAPIQASPFSCVACF